MNAHKRTQNLKKTTAIAMFAALAYICVVIIRIPNIGGFLTLDFKDVIITIGAMFFGPIAAVVLSILVPLLEFLTVSGTGVYGLIMNFISSFTFAFVASVIYKYKKNLVGAIIGLLSAVVSVTAIMMLANLLITPYYTGMPTAAVAALIPKLLLPFNLTKAILNAALTMMLYKPLTNILKKTRLYVAPSMSDDKNAQDKKKARARSVLIFAVSLVVVAAAICVIIVVWNGEISFFDIFKSKS